jgi:long-chain acyl-CoA synthetase
MKLERAFDILFHQLETLPRPDCLSAKTDGQWQSMSSSAVMEAVNALSLGLLQQGIQRGDTVAIAADNCPEWVIVDFALQQIGAISVPLYPTCTLEDALYPGACRGQAGVCRQQRIAAQAGTGALWPTLPCYALKPLDTLPCWTVLRDAGRQGKLQQLALLRNSIQPDDVFTIIYTSGTTGRAKGVMLSHRNVVSTVTATAAHTRLPAGQCRALSFLPLSHIFERAGVLYYLLTGSGVYFSSVEALSGSLAEVRPHTFSAVPRVLEKVHEKLHARAATLKGWQRRFYLWALAQAEAYEPNQPPRGLAAIRHAIADRLVYRKWRAAMGGELRWVNVGSAALQPRLARLLWASGIAVAEGYGMTEAAPVITANPFSR